MRDRDVGPGRERIDVPAHDPCRIELVVDVVQDAAQDQRQRAGEIEVRGDLRVSQQSVGLGQVRGHEMRVRVALEQDAAVDVAHRVVVDVHHARVGILLLRDLVGVADGRQSGADIEELVDAGGTGQVAHHAMQPAAIHPGHITLPRRDFGDLVAHVAIDLVIVLATEGGVVDSGDARACRVHAYRRADTGLGSGIGHGDLSLVSVAWLTSLETAESASNPCGCVRPVLFSWIQRGCARPGPSMGTGRCSRGDHGRLGCPDR